MDRSKIIAIITGVISIILAFAYLLLVTLLDFRGEMLPAPQSRLPVSLSIQQLGIANPTWQTPRIYPQL
jgi:cell shape-determining protein MreC